MFRSRWKVLSLLASAVFCLGPTCGIMDGPPLVDETAIEPSASIDDSEDELVLGYTPEVELHISCPESVLSGSFVEIDASASYSPRTDNLAYVWWQLEGPDLLIQDASGPICAFIAPSVQSDTLIRLGVTVQDSRSWAEDEIELWIVPIDDDASTEDTESAAVDQLPEGFDFEATVVDETDSLNITFTAIMPEELTTEAYELNWDWGDGTVGQGQNMQHRYAAAGTYLVVLCATSQNLPMVCVERSVIAQSLPSSSPVDDGSGAGGLPSDQPGSSHGKMQSISQYGITWTLDRPYSVGRFVTGDWWVVPDSPGGTITVQSISPAPTGTGKNLRHGSMINPSPTAGKQAYNGRGYDFEATLQAKAPLTLSAGQSLLSSISVPDPPSPKWAINQTIAVLTCLASAPPADAFRPHYSTGPRTLYRASNLKLEHLLSLNPPPTLPNRATLERKFERPWIDHFADWRASSLHPLDNFPDCTYGREMALAVGEAALYLLCDPQRTGDKTTLLHRLVQVGIDNHGLLISGQRWAGDGGHAQGRKFPILFAGLMLDQAAMLDIGTDYPPDSISFGEDHQSAYVTQAAIDATQQVEVSGTVTAAGADTLTLDQKVQDLRQGNELTIVAGPGQGQRRTLAGFDDDTRICTLTEPWAITPVAGQSQYQILGYEAKHLGMPEWGSRLRASNWVQANPSREAGYRMCCTGNSWVGSCLAARLLNLQGRWNNDAFFDYVDRYLGELEGGTVSQFVKQMWDAHR